VVDGKAGDLAFPRNTEPADRPTSSCLHAGRKQDWAVKVTSGKALASSGGSKQRVVFHQTLPKGAVVTGEGRAKLSRHRINPVLTNLE